MESLKKAMKWDEERFNLEYDLDIYMIVAVDFFNMGAMENKGLNIFNSKFVLANPQTATDDDYLAIESVIAHEYFHTWFVKRIKPAELVDASFDVEVPTRLLWLFEGFTSYYDNFMLRRTGLANDAEQPCSPKT